MTATTCPHGADQITLDGKLWELAWPLLITYSLSLSRPVIDALFLRQVSDDALAAIGGVLPLLSAVHVIFIAIGQAGCTVASQMIGSGQHARVPQIYAVLIASNALAAVPPSLGFYFLQHEIPRALGLSGSVAQYAASYLVAVGSSQVLVATVFAYVSIISSVGATRVVLLGSLVSTLTNIGLNSVFASGFFGFRAGGSVYGVASATVITTLLLLSVLIVIAHRRLRIALTHRDHPTSLATLRTSFGSLMRIGLPAALEPLSYQGAQTVITKMVVSLGTDALAARVYMLNLFAMNTIISLALGQATQILVAHQTGGRSFSRADAQFHQSLRLGMGVTFALAVVLAVLHTPLIDALIQNADVREQCSRLFWLALLIEPCRAANIIATGALRSTGDARYTSFVAVICTWGLGIPLCHLLGIAWHYALLGVWWGIALDEATRVGLNVARWRSGRWREQSVCASGTGA